MFLRRHDYDRLTDELATCRARALVMHEQAVQTRTQMAFLVGQINTLQKERAVLLRHVTKLEIPIPELALTAAPAVQHQEILAAMGSSMFEDMGDDEARKQGLAWDTDGGVVARTHSANGVPTDA